MNLGACFENGKVRLDFTYLHMRATRFWVTNSLMVSRPSHLRPRTWKYFFYHSTHSTRPVGGQCARYMFHVIFFCLKLQFMAFQDVPKQSIWICKPPSTNLDADWGSGDQSLACLIRVRSACPLRVQAWTCAITTSNWPCYTNSLVLLSCLWHILLCLQCACPRFWVTWACNSVLLASQLY